MPTPLPSNEKADFIKIVQAAPYPGGPLEAFRLESILNNYEDVFTAIMRELPLFASNNAYLTAAIGVFTDANLMAVGIWNNKTISSPPLTDPALIINSTITNWPVFITPSSPPINQVLCILGNSRIQEITVEAYTNLTELYIGPASVVDLVDSTATNAIINTIYLPYIRNTPSRLNTILFNSQVNQIVLEDGSYFGGYSNDNPMAVCDLAITNFSTQAPLNHNSIILTWTPPYQSPPDAYLFINTYYRQAGSNTWLQASEDIGYFNDDHGFAFTQLEEGTSYEFRVGVVCVNGGINTSDILEATTTCCS